MLKIKEFIFLNKEFDQQFALDLTIKEIFIVLFTGITDIRNNFYNVHQFQLKILFFKSAILEF